MTPLLAAPLAIVLTTLTGLLLLVLAAAGAALVLLALLALDLLLERNGVDRRAALRRVWDRLRRSGAPTARPGGARTGARSEPHGTERDASASRIPFSARRPARPARPTATDDAPTTPVPPSGPRAAETAPAEPATPGPAAPATTAVAEPPTPAADAPTEVLAVAVPPAPRARAARTPRVTPRRSPAPEPAPQDAPGAAPAPEEDTTPVDRDSAMDRLFAPLLETDQTEPLPTPRATRPARRPRDGA